MFIHVLYTQKYSFSRCDNFYWLLTEETKPARSFVWRGARRLLGFGEIFPRIWGEGYKRSFNVLNFPNVRQSSSEVMTGMLRQLLLYPCGRSPHGLLRDGTSSSDSQGNLPKGYKSSCLSISISPCRECCWNTREVYYSCFILCVPTPLKHLLCWHGN